MNFIGYCVEKKHENILEQSLKKTIGRNQLIAVNDNSIDNIKNIKFETIIINNELKDIIQKEKMKNLFANAKYLVINSDKVDLYILHNMDVMPITYGYNSKATLTMSSVEDDKMILCLQRSIINILNKMIEPQEICVDIEYNDIDRYLIMCTNIIKLLYD